MAPQKYTEQNFEEHIEEQLLASGYQKRLPEEYNKDMCLIPEDVLGFIKATQPKPYENLEKQYGAETDEKLLYHIADSTKSGAPLNSNVQRWSWRLKKTKQPLCNG
ncbi:MAG: hypothetical protein NTX52_04985 [Planctomycetota bacterium]|nr:hypothetical protein [Planctomycetota bacterium]